MPIHTDCDRPSTGAVISSYPIEDRKQIVDDNDLFTVHDAGRGHIQCILCDEPGLTDSMVHCRTCTFAAHAFCVGSRHQPLHFQCSWCEVYEPGTPSAPYYEPYVPDRTFDSSSASTSARLSNASANSTDNRDPSYNDGSLSDSDDPDATLPLVDPSTASYRQEFRQWQRHFEATDHQGSAARFRQTAQALLNPRHQPSARATPPREVQEETQAWEAFDKALEDERSGRIAPPSGTTTANKRRASSSPEPRAKEPPRQLKRPRTRRFPDASEQGSEPTGEALSSATSRPFNGRKGLSTSTSSRRSDTQSNEPSLLQSLLKQVEDIPPSSKAAEAYPFGSSPPGSRPESDVGSITSPIAMRSPMISPLTGPRASSQSPSSNQSSRANSPPPLASRIEPDYGPPLVNNSPTSPINTNGSPRLGLHSQSQAHSPTLPLHLRSQSQAQSPTLPHRLRSQSQAHSPTLPFRPHNPRPGHGDGPNAVNTRYNGALQETTMYEYPSIPHSLSRDGRISVLMAKFSRPSKVNQPLSPSLSLSFPSPLPSLRCMRVRPDWPSESVFSGGRPPTMVMV